MDAVAPSCHIQPVECYGSSSQFQQKVHQNLFSLLMKGIVPEGSEQNQKSIRHTLQQHIADISSLNPVSSLVCSHQYRVQLLKISSDLQLSNDPSIRDALQKDEAHILNLLKNILSSDTERRTVLCLRGEDAQKFVNLVQDILDRNDDGRFCHEAHRLLVKLSEASNILPAALSVKGVTLRDKHPKFGGGFSDIFRASYQGKKVALKRMRVFQRGKEHRSLQSINRKFCREALLWQRLRHPFVLPFFGIDYETFPPFSCMVLPWMKHGTILKHLADTGNLNINTRIFEVAQGLEYLHSQDIVHGDLRGANILINDAWHAVLADFGLAVFVDATADTSHSNGSARWTAPELSAPESFKLRKSRRTPASDVYAFGCTCLEIYTGRPPFSEAKSDFQVIMQVTQAVRPERPSGDSGRAMPDDLWRVVEHCWVQQPSERPCMGDVVRSLRKGHVNSESVDHSLPQFLVPGSPPGSRGFPEAHPNVIASVGDGGIRLTELQIVPSGPLGGGDSQSRTGPIQPSLETPHQGSSRKLSGLYYVTQSHNLRSDRPNRGTSYFRPQQDFIAPQDLHIQESLASVHIDPHSDASGSRSASDDGDSRKVSGSTRSRPYPSPFSNSRAQDDELWDVALSGRQGRFLPSINQDGDPTLVPEELASEEQAEAMGMHNPSVVAGRTGVPPILMTTFACPVPSCGSTFMSISDLKEHLQSHIEEMPYQCRWLGCGNGFPRWHDRNEHEKLHKRRDI